MERISHWIAGKVVPGESGRTAPVYNPATGAQTHEVDLASTAELGTAVDAAAEAFPAWRSTSLSKRADIFFRIRELLEQRKPELARIVTSQHGKVVSDAAGEVQRGIENVEYACGIPNLLKGGFSEQVATGVDVYSIRQPLGVVAGITPFNFPAWCPCGCSPTPSRAGTPSSSSRARRTRRPRCSWRRCSRRRGSPTASSTSCTATRRPSTHLPSPRRGRGVVRRSTPIARYIYETGTANGKRVQALGGAKNHMFVLPDADLDMAADAAVSAGYGSAGERCMAVSMVVAVGDIGDELVRKIAQRLPAVKVGDGTDPGTRWGRSSRAAPRQGRLLPRQRSGAGRHASSATGVRTTSGRDGFFLGVSLLDHVTPEMDCYRDEIFGPCSGHARRDLRRSGRLVNDNPYGNGAATSRVTAARPAGSSSR